ncbi:MAG: 2-succinyl-5-enolpyruvyl-6-hydroxy-3-cyclohexene-1-carboxylic-acid synthase [Acidimicrobiales bacterium]
MATPGDISAAFCATLVDEWVRAGVTHAVVAPGSRSTPLAVALAARHELRLHVFHDERSAGFAALGIGRATGVPAVLLCTSGTAAAHFVAPVVEAHQSRVPVLVCTADRPPELRDVSAPQTIDQTKLFGSAVRWFHDPGVPADDARGSWRALARRSVAATTAFVPGPVHLNLPFREPLLGDAGELPPAGETHVPSAVAGVDASSLMATASRLAARRGVVVAGRGSTHEVLSFAEATGWPVLADATSGLRECHPNVVVAFDPVLRVPQFADRNMPEVIVRVGDPPASKVLAQWTARTGARVVQVSWHDRFVDPDHLVAETVIGPVDKVMALLAGAVAPAPDGWLGAWSAAEAAAQRAISDATDATFGEPTVARRVTDTRAAGSSLVVSSSMPIRDVEWFGTVTPGVTVHANRGANGIDGVVSTAVGVALGSSATTTLLIGDVAFIHDSNGLWGLGRRDVDLTVVVVNNDGGSIFSFLPQAAATDHNTFETLWGTPHGVDIAHLCAAHGIAHTLVTDRDGLERALAGSGTRVIEVRTDRAANVAVHDALNAAVAAVITA